MSGKRGIFGGHAPFVPITCLCHAFSNNSIAVTGDSKGLIIPWTNNQAGKEYKGHQGSVGSLLGFKNSLFSGGQDGIVITWGMQGGELIKINVVADINTLTKYNPSI